MVVVVATDKRVNQLNIITVKLRLNILSERHACNTPTKTGFRLVQASN